MIAGRKNEPGAELLNLFNKCSPMLAEQIQSKIQALGVKFTERYTAPSDNHPGSHASFAAMRLRLGEVLYYRILEKVLTSEQKTSKSIAILLEQDAFHQVISGNNV